MEQLPSDEDFQAASLTVLAMSADDLEALWDAAHGSPSTANLFKSAGDGDPGPRPYILLGMAVGILAERKRTVSGGLH
jgi:hypothetical protein